MLKYDCVQKHAYHQVKIKYVHIERKIYHYKDIAIKIFNEKDKEARKPFKNWASPKNGMHILFFIYLWTVKDC